MVKTHWLVPNEIDIFNPKESQSLVLKTNHRGNFEVIGNYM